MSNTTTAAERQRLQAELTRIEQQINGLQARMDTLAELRADAQAALAALAALNEYETTP